MVFAIHVSKELGIGQASVSGKSPCEAGDGRNDGDVGDGADQGDGRLHCCCCVDGAGGLVEHGDDGEAGGRV